MLKTKIILKVSDDDPDVAYLYLPDHPGNGVSNVVKKNLRLGNLIDGYKGPDVILDFDQNGKLIGIEILA